MSEKVSNIYHQHNLEQAKRFYLKAFRTLSEGSGDKSINMRENLRQQFVDEFEFDNQLSVEQIDNHIRILGSNFFSVIGVEQPRSADKYEAIIKSFISTGSQPNIDKS